VYPNYHACLATRHVEKFREAMTFLSYIYLITEQSLIQYLVIVLDGSLKRWSLCVSSKKTTVLNKMYYKSLEAKVASC